MDIVLINAENLYKHFSEVGPKLRDSTPVYCDISFTDFLRSNNYQCKFSTVSSDKIQGYSNSISSDKSTTGLIPLRVFKAILPILLPTVSPT